jgi:hypothetical protein
MGIDIEMWGESFLRGWEGASPPERLEGLPTFDRLLAPVWRQDRLQEFKVLQCIDPYGVTVFNQLQIPALLEDLERLRPLLETSEQRRALDGVLELARRAYLPSTFLVFIGD